MDDSFREAFLHKESHRVAGRSLRPFSLAAWFVLEVLDSPLLFHESAAVSLADVQLASKVCACANPLRANLLPTLRDRWTQRLRGKSVEYLRREGQAFVHYLDDYAALPRFWRNEEDEHAKKITAPWLLSRVCSLMRSTAMPPERIWLMPAGEAFWYDAGIRELEGAQLRFFRDGDDEEDVPNLLANSEQELYDIALRELGEENAKIWWELRCATRAKETQS